MRGHHQMRQHRLGGGLARQRGVFGNDRVRTGRMQQLELGLPRGAGAAVGEVDDLALAGAVDGGVRLLDEACKALRVPVIAACLPLLAVHALLYHRPLAVVGDDEAVQIEIEAVLHGGAVDLGDEAAGAGQRLAIQADAVAQRHELLRRAARMLAAPAADVDAKLMLQRRQAALQRADDARGDAR
jgi:hypothetical protein